MVMAGERLLAVLAVGGALVVGILPAGALAVGVDGVDRGTWSLFVS